MPKTVECPHCHQLNAVPLAGIGQYVTCQACKCKYYVYVPPLAEGRGESTIVEPATISRQTNGADADEDSVAIAQRADSHVMFRQESLLATIHEDLVDLRRRITIACFLFVLGCSAVIATVLLR
jgi:hypothetical protein